MKKKDLPLNNKEFSKHDLLIVNFVTQICYLPFIYIIYCFKTIREVYRHSINMKFTRKDFILQFSYTFIGILTLNFYLYLGIEFEFFQYDFNRIINEINFIPFYLKNFTILLIYSVILYALCVPRRGFDLFYLKSILLLNIKLFNIFMPMLFVILIFTLNTFFFFISSGKNDYFIFSLIFFLTFIFILLLILYLILLFKSRKFLIDIYKKKITANLILVFLVILTVFTYSKVIYKVTNYIGIKDLIHKYEFCQEIIDFNLYKNEYVTPKKYTFIQYRKDILNCQKMLKKSDEELFQLIEKSYNKIKN